MTNKTHPHIRVCLWDVDSTLYRPDSRIHDEIRRAEIKTVADYLHIPFEDASRRFYEIYKTKTPSGTATAAFLCSIPVAEAAGYMEKLYDRSQALSPDNRLVAMFRSLHAYRHFILSNGATAGINAILKSLGLDPEMFEAIVTSETTGVNKPDTAGFLYILHRTGLPPEAHLMIGDREAVDIVPAKTVGMQTCLVWAAPDEKSVADYRAATVYEVPEVAGL